MRPLLQPIPNVASYVGNPQALEGLKAINFFYGSNGSGKTTISRVIADPSHPDHVNCRLAWKNGRAMDVLVYNRDFVDANFGGDDHFKGVFTVGKRSVEAIQKIGELKTLSQEMLDKVAGLRGTLRGPNPEVEAGKLGDRAILLETLQAKCWAQKVKYEKEFGVAFEGVRSSKLKFFGKVLETFAAKSTSVLSPATLDDMRERAKTVFGPSSGPESLIRIPSALKLLELESHPILAKVVVGKKDVDVAALIERLGNSDWVKQGHTYLHRSDGVCPFCQQPEPQNLKAQLAEYFDEAFLADTAAIAAFEDAYVSAAEEWIGAIDEVIASKNPRLDIEALRLRRETAEAKISANALLIAEKRREPSRPIELHQLAEATASTVEVLSTANESIRNYNAMVADLVKEKAKLSMQIWRHIADVELQTDLVEYHNAEAGLSKAIQSLQDNIAKTENDLKQVEAQIQVLEKDATSVQPTIDAINKLLASYGFHGFSIERVGDRDQYRLRRADGTSARTTLSEGERTFITFLYFYFLAQGSASATGTQSERVVVLDDPVSSLDSDVLFIVSSRIHRLMRSVRSGTDPIKQLLVLTHNVHFHKEVSFSSERHKGSLKDETFWMVRKTRERSMVEFHPDNPVASSYEMLWAEVRRSGPHPPGIQNTLRRILETYFKILGNIDFKQIAEKFEPEDQPICNSLFSWVNAGSHSALDDLHFALDASAVERHLSVFKRVFEVSEHLPHYKMMMRQGPEEGGAAQSPVRAVEMQAAQLV